MLRGFYYSYSILPSRYPEEEQALGDLTPPSWGTRSCRGSGGVLVSVTDTVQGA